MRHRTAIVLALAVLLTAACSSPGRALTPPGLVLDVGKTTAISGPLDGGGISLGIGALWDVQETPWNLPLRFGVMGYWDDMGSDVTDLLDSRNQSLGLVADGHQSAFGGAFRLDWEPRPFPALRTYGSGTWGYYRVSDDVRGSGLGGVSAPGFSLGLGLGHHFYEGHALGVVVRYHRLFDDVTGRYVSGAVEWDWRSSATR